LFLEDAFSKHISGQPTYMELARIALVGIAKMKWQPSDLEDGGANWEAKSSKIEANWSSL